MSEIIKIDENTWRIEDDFVRFFLLTGNEKAVLLDSGMSCVDAKTMAESLTDLPIMLMNTHGDRDHVSGTGCFSQIYMHRADYEGCGIGENYPQVELIEVNDGDCMDLGGRTLKMIHIPGHTRGSVAILDVEKRVLFAGDSVQKGQIFMFGGHRDPEQFEDSLLKLMELAPAYDTVIASHEEPILPGDYTEKVLAAWRAVRQGQVEYRMIDQFGFPVKAYFMKDCGFFMD